MVSDEDLARIKAAMPELPAAKCDRFIREYGLSKYDATLLGWDGATASFLEDYGQGQRGCQAGRQLDAWRGCGWR